MAQVPVGETRDMLPDAPARQGPEPEQLMDVEDLAGVTAEDPIEVEVREQITIDEAIDESETAEIEALIAADEEAEKRKVAAEKDAAITDFEEQRKKENERKC